MGAFRWDSSQSDHPRSRGVYQTKYSPPTIMIGSSPLARGLRNVVDCHLRAIGIIPARAGFTGVCRVRRVWAWDHPRSRGVYTLMPHPSSPSLGSSPLARGLRGLCLFWIFPARIIPARAGFTIDNGLRQSEMRDHPRSRGVYATHNVESAPAPGSSPLARGLLADPLPGCDHPGIIPARAGFTIKGSGRAL